MLVIRGAQIFALGEDSRRRFIERMVRMVERDFPHVCRGQDPAQRLAWVEARYADARAAAFEKSSHVRAWIQLAAAHGEDFAQSPWAAPVLSDSALTADEKMSLLDERALFAETVS